MPSANPEQDSSFNTFQRFQIVSSVETDSTPFSIFFISASYD
jgi:hypothetical protein